MATTNTPLYDLVELSGINANATYTVTPGGGGDIIGVVDNATYTDGDGSNTATEITELNETGGSNGGTLTIDGVVYSLQLYVPDGTGQEVTVTYDNGASSTNLGGDALRSDVVFIMATPTGGGAARYFVLFDDTVGDLNDITSIQTRNMDFDPAGDDVRINADQNNNVAPVCFALGTLIETPAGPRPVEALRVGDLVRTRQGGDQPIRWIGRRRMTFTVENAAHKPILIRAGALGPGRPARDLMVSPQHRIAFNGPVVQRLFGSREVLAVAKGLTGLHGIRAMTGKREAQYFSLLLDQHHILVAEGAETESFYPGPTALSLLSPRQRAEVISLFPALAADPRSGYGPPACPVLTRRQTMDLAQAIKRRGAALPEAGPIARAAPPRPAPRSGQRRGARRASA